MFKNTFLILCAATGVAILFVVCALASVSITVGVHNQLHKHFPIQDGNSDDR